MDAKEEIGAFLVSRRGRIRPETVGLPGGGIRRVPGLRRGEVAMLAGVSVEHYTRIERGTASGVSDVVLDSIARALRLDEAEREHLFALVRSSNASGIRPARRVRISQQPRESLQWMLDAVTGAAAFVRNGRMDIIATNAIARALYDDVFAMSPDHPNIARFTFLDRVRSESFYPDWEGDADTCVAILRSEAGRAPHDRQLQDLVGELSTRSEDFRRRWASHDVRRHGTGQKTFHHSSIGSIDLTFEGADLVAEEGLNLLIYSARPGSAAADSLALLGSWGATRVASDRVQEGEPH